MIDGAVKHFKKGSVVIFPTDTVYGIGCDIRYESAISRVHKIRRDPYLKPMLILASDTNQAAEYGIFDSLAKNLLTNFWPGPLTVVVKAQNKSPRIIQGKGRTIGIRVPNQPSILKIIKKVGAPIVAPSANFHKDKTPTSFQEIDKGILALVDYAIDLSKLDDIVKMTQKVSTVIDLTKRPFRILRSGTISRQKIQEAWEESEK